MTRSFFLSRAGEDTAWGRWIHGVLTGAGHSCFLQDYDMPNGSFPEHIRNGMACRWRALRAGR